MWHINVTVRIIETHDAYEAQRTETYLFTSAPNEDSNQPAHPRSDQSSLSHAETLDPWLSKRRSVKIQIRLRESSLDAHA